jgi:hypothetical protein
MKDRERPVFAFVLSVRSRNVGVGTSVASSLWLTVGGAIVGSRAGSQLLRSMIE